MGYSITITGRSEQKIVPDPKREGRFLKITDTSPMGKHYLSEAHAVAEAKHLDRVLQTNPDAVAELPDGKKMPLSGWIAEASRRLSPPKPAAEPESELPELPPSAEVEAAELPDGA